MKRLEQLRRLLGQLQLPRSGGPWLIAPVAILIAGIVLSVDRWDWLNGGESAGATVRNIGLVIAGSLALPLAIWRGVVADKQASAAQCQTAQDRETLLNERYQQGAEMLGSNVLAVRMGGIYALQQLAQEHPNTHHLQVMNLFCAFVRRPPQDPEANPRMPTVKDVQLLRQDVQAVMDAIVARDESRRNLEQNLAFTLDLQDSDLAGAQMDLSIYLDGRKVPVRALINQRPNPRLNPSRLEFSGAHLSNAQLLGANLQNARLNEADLSGADLSAADLTDARLEKANLTGYVSLIGAILRGTRLCGADLSNATFYLANVSGTDFYGAGDDDECLPAKGLTQSMLDLAIADPNNPPKLGGVVLDAETGEPLVWRK